MKQLELVKNFSFQVLTLWQSFQETGLDAYVEYFSFVDRDYLERFLSQSLLFRFFLVLTSEDQVTPH